MDVKKKKTQQTDLPLCPPDPQAPWGLPPPETAASVVSAGGGGEW